MVAEVSDMTESRFGRRGYSGPRQAYEPGERAKFIQRAQRLLAAGGLTVPVVAERLGLNVSTLYNWLRQDEVGGFRTVTLVAEETTVVAPAPCQAVLTSPGGYRVEGLDLEGVAELLRRLS